MKFFFNVDEDERRRLCGVAADLLGLDPQSIEKDLWVCWCLRELFAMPDFGPHMTFKGGTSLSKGWKFIDRFSEDLDVVVDRAYLGFGAEHAPEHATNNKQRERLLVGLAIACKEKIHRDILPVLEQHFTRNLSPRLQWKLFI